MGLVDARCPHCGAPIKVNPEAESLTCRYCGSDFVVKDAISNVNISDSTIHNDMRGANVYVNTNLVSNTNYKQNNNPVDESWIDNWKQKKKKSKVIWCISGIILTILGIILLILAIKILNITFVFFGTFFGIFGLIMLIFSFFVFKIERRKIDGYIVVVYSGAKQFLIVDNKIQYTGGAFCRHLYAELPNGRRISADISAFDGSIKINIEN